MYAGRACVLIGTSASQEGQVILLETVGWK